MAKKSPFFCIFVKMFDTINHIAIGFQMPFSQLCKINGNSEYYYFMDLFECHTDKVEWLSTVLTYFSAN